MNFFKTKTGVKSKVSAIRNQRSVVSCDAGFTMTELVVVLAVMSLLIGIGYSQMRTPKEKIVCKNIYSAMQLAKMRAVATGYNAYVDFDMAGGNVTDDFYTIYLDTDSDGAAFGELSNANTENEFNESGANLPDTSSAGFPGVALLDGIQFGGKTNSPRGGTMANNGPAPNMWIITDSGVNVTDNRFIFTPKGTANWGEVYLWNTESSAGLGCLVDVSSTGMIRMKKWDGTNWS